MRKILFSLIFAAFFCAGTNVSEKVGGTVSQKSSEQSNSLINSTELIVSVDLLKDLQLKNLEFKKSHYVRITLRL